MLEATLVVIDNSEWMRNGDYTPTRLQAQQDAVNLICGAKTQLNPENTVGLMTFAGKSPEVLVTLTNDLGKIITSLHAVAVNGNGNFVRGIQIAQLALKHRQNKNQRQRVILFVGSPIVEDERELVKLGKKLKKNNVAVDVVNFGEEAENTGKLEAFIAAVNSSDNSHLVTVPPGPHILSDILISSPIISGEEGGSTAAMAAAAAAGRGGNFDFGADGGGFDPDLELALRISMEEERARQEREAAAARGESAAPPAAAAAPGGAADAPATTDEAAQALAEAAAMADDDDMDEEAMLAQALAMSLMGAGGGSGSQQQEHHEGDKKDDDKMEH